MRVHGGMAHFDARGAFLEPTIAIPIHSRKSSQDSPRILVTTLATSLCYLVDFVVDLDSPTNFLT